MIRNMRDIAIFILTVYIFAVMMWARLSPEEVGQWKARMDVSYDSIWSEYIFDCDCTEALE
jgi:hypothetical protein